MKKAKKRKFREPPFWVKILFPVNTWEAALRNAVVYGTGVLRTGEIGWIDSGFVFYDAIDKNT